MHSITFAAHVVYLSPMTGDGLLGRPLAAHDIPAPDKHGMSLHSADWTNVIATLDARGWELSESEDGGMSVDGHLPDGREVIGLYGREPITSDPSFDETADAFDALCRAVGLVPMPV